jgi:DNA-binding PadR family transcriptional regulator
LAKATPRQLALEALARALADPAAKVLHGSKKQPGFFSGSAQAVKQAAQFCLDQGWLEPTGDYEGKGKTRKPTYRLTPAGAQAVLQDSEPVKLLQSAVDSLQQNSLHLESIRARLEETVVFLARQKEAVHGLRELVAKLQDRLQPPDLECLQAIFQRPASVPGATAADWLARALDYIAEYQRRHPYGHCPLPELFHQVAEPARVSIGQFHDGLRRLVEQGQVRLHAFTAAAYQLQEEQFALVAGQEIKYYAERLARS